MKEIKVRLPDSLITSIEREAKARKINRAEVMRERLADIPSCESITPDVFYQTVNKVRHKIGNILTRSQAENVVAACLVEFKSLEASQ
jgi:N-glycosylase/DNA lyase|tara:strand:+ start:149 stop:412 length:264 start_codon:yes stop_codon:yes gene_type:complete